MSSNCTDTSASAPAALDLHSILKSACTPLSPAKTASTISGSVESSSVVELYVYDLKNTPLFTSLGRWQTSIVVHWCSSLVFEYSYTSKGIRVSLPGDSQYSVDPVWTTTLSHSNLRMSLTGFHEWINLVRHNQYTADSYDPASVNSNHFSDTAASVLIGESVTWRLKPLVDDLHAQRQREGAETLEQQAEATNSFELFPSRKSSSPVKKFTFRPSKAELWMFIKLFPFVAVMYFKRPAKGAFLGKIPFRFCHRIREYWTGGERRPPALGFALVPFATDDTRTDEPLTLDIWAYGRRELVLCAPDESIAVALTKQVIRRHCTPHSHYCRERESSILPLPPPIVFNQALDFDQLIKDIDASIEQREDPAAMLHSRVCLVKVIESYRTGRKLGSLMREEWRKSQRELMAGHSWERMAPFFDLLRSAFMQQQEPLSDMEALFALVVDALNELFKLSGTDASSDLVARLREKRLFGLFPRAVFPHVAHAHPASSAWGATLALTCQLVANVLATPRKQRAVLGPEVAYLRDAVNLSVMTLSTLNFAPDMIHQTQAACASALFNQALERAHLRHPWDYHSDSLLTQARHATLIEDFNESLERCYAIVMSLNNWKDLNLGDRGSSLVSKGDNLATLWLLLSALFKTLYLAPKHGEIFSAMQRNKVGLSALLDSLEASMDGNAGGRGANIVRLLRELKDLMALSGF